jgi:hypothetical protein
MFLRWDGVRTRRTVLTGTGTYSYSIGELEHERRYLFLRSVLLLLAVLGGDSRLRHVETSLHGVPGWRHARLSCASQIRRSTCGSTGVRAIGGRGRCAARALSGLVSRALLARVWPQSMDIT